MPDDPPPDGRPSAFQRFMMRAAAVFLGGAILFSLKVAYDKIPQSNYAPRPAEPIEITAYRAPAPPTATPTPKPTPKKTPRPTPTRTPKPTDTPHVPVPTTTPADTASAPFVAASPANMAPLEPAFRFTTPTPYATPDLAPSEAAPPAPTPLPAISSSRPGPREPATSASAATSQPQPAPLEEFEPRPRLQIGGGKYAASHPDDAADARLPSSSVAASQAPLSHPSTSYMDRPSSPSSPETAPSATHHRATVASATQSGDRAGTRTLSLEKRRASSTAPALLPPVPNATPLGASSSQAMASSAPAATPGAKPSGPESPAATTMPARSTPGPESARSTSSPAVKAAAIEPPPSHPAASSPASSPAAPTPAPATTQPASSAPSLSSRSWWEVVDWTPEEKNGQVVLTIKVEVKDLDNLNEKQFAGLCRHIVETAGFAQNKVQVGGKASRLPGTLRVEAVSALTSGTQNGQWRGVAEWRRATGAVHVISAPKAGQ